MDSPLMPTLRNMNAEMDHSLLADMTLSSPPSSPTSRKPAQLAPLASSSSSSSNFNSTTSQKSHTHSFAQPDEEVDDAEGNDEPIAQKGTKTKPKPRFSLFAPQAIAASTSSGPLSSSNRSGLEERPDPASTEGSDQTPTSATLPRTQSTAARDEKLRESLYELREMNNVFEGFLSALEDARGHNERLAARVSQTSALLDQYTSLLAQTEHTQRLLLNPKWTGAEDDAMILHLAEEAERAAEAARVAAEIEMEAAREREREKEKDERERGNRTPSGGAGGGAGRGRGRGGASIGAGGRGRGAAVGVGAGRGTTTTSSTGIPRPSVAGGGGSIETVPSTGGKRPPSAGGRYADVKGSGYGPKRS